MLYQGILNFNLALAIVVMSMGVTNSYLIDFNKGIPDSIYVSEGRNVTTIMDWSGFGLFVSPNNTTGKVKTEIYSYHNGKILFDYQNLKKVYYEFWFSGANSDINSDFGIGIGEIKKYTVVYNFVKVRIYAHAYSKYGDLKVYRLSLIWGKNNGNFDYDEHTYKIIESNTGINIHGNFALSLDFSEYPQRIITTFIYPHNSQNGEYITYINKPLEFGKYINFPKDGNPSPIFLFGHFSPTSKMNNEGVVVDNINLEFIPNPTIHQSTNIGWLIIIVIAVAVPIAVIILFTRKQ